MRIRGTTNKDELRPAPAGLNPHRTLALQNRDAHIARVLATQPLITPSARKSSTSTNTLRGDLPLLSSRRQPAININEYNERNRLAEDAEEEAGAQVN